MMAGKRVAQLCILALKFVNAAPQGFDLPPSIRGRISLSQASNNTMQLAPQFVSVFELRGQTTRRAV